MKLPRTLLATAFLAALPLCAAEIRLGILGAEADPDLAAVLIAELGAIEGVSLLERDDLRRIESEGELGKLLAGENYEKAGALLKADGLLILGRKTVDGRPVDSARLVAVSPGVVISEILIPDKSAPITERANAVKNRLQPLLPKLAVKAGEAIALSLLNFRAVMGTPELLPLEGAFTTLMSDCLLREPRIFLLERSRMEALEEEARIGGPANAYWTATYLLEGTLESDGRHLRIKSWLKGTGRPPIEWTLDADPKNLAGAVTDLAAKIAGSLQTQATAGPWKSDVEASFYRSEALWCQSAGLISPGLAAANASWALGNRSFDLARARLFFAVKSIDGSASPRNADAMRRRIRQTSAALQAAADLAALNPAPTPAQTAQQITFFKLYDGAKALQAAVAVFRSEASAPPDPTLAEDLRHLRKLYQDLVARLTPLAADAPSSEFEGFRDFKKAVKAGAAYFPASPADIVNQVLATLANPREEFTSFRKRLWKEREKIFAEFGKTDALPTTLWAELRRKMSESPAFTMDGLMLDLHDPASPGRERLAEALVEALQSNFSRIILEKKAGAWLALVTRNLTESERQKNLLPRLSGFIRQYFESAQYLDRTFLDYFLSESDLKKFPRALAEQIHAALATFALRVERPKSSPVYREQMNAYLARIEELYPDLRRFQPENSLAAKAFWSPHLESAIPLGACRIIDFQDDGQSLLLLTDTGYDTPESLRVYQLALPSLKSTFLPVPAKRIDSPQNLAVSKKKIYVGCREFTLAWDIAAQRWDKLDYPVWEALNGDVYRLASDKNDASTLSRTREGEANFELLISTRRNPPLNQFEASSHINFYEIFPGPQGRPCISINVRPWFIQPSSGNWETIWPAVTRGEGFSVQDCGSRAFLYSHFWNIAEAGAGGLRPIMLNPEGRILFGAKNASGCLDAPPDWKKNKLTGPVSTDGQNVAALRYPSLDTGGTYLIRWFSPGAPETAVSIRFTLPPQTIQALRSKWSAKEIHMIAELEKANPEPRHPRLFLRPEGLYVLGPDEGVWFFDKKGISGWKNRSAPPN